MRAFFALTPPETVRAAVGATVARAEAAYPAKWVRPDDFHVTLVFVGEVTEQQLTALTATAAPVVARHAPMAVSLAGANTFDDRVLWVGVEGDLARLAALAGELGAALAVTSNHPTYTPHLTVARAARKGGDPRLPSIAAEAFGAARFGDWVADRVTVYESRDGRYFARASLPLAAGR